MKVTVSEPKKSEVTIKIEVEDSELEKYFEKAVKKLGEEVKISGFRPGKIPRDVLEKQVGEGAIRAYAIDLALPHFYADAVIENKVQVVAKPEIKIVSDTPFVFEAAVAILPEVKITGYNKIKVDKKETKVSDKEVEELIDYFRKQQATNTEVKRAAKKGDRVEIDFDGFDPEGDVPLEGTSSKNHPVVLGEGSLIPGFEEEITGMKAGEEKTFGIQFPKDYKSKKFQGKKAKFKVKLHRVQEMKLPEITKEWIKQITGKEQPEEEFRKSVRENLVQERALQEKTRRENHFLDEMVKLAKVDLPDALIEEEIDFIMDRTKMDLESKGLQWEQYKKYLEGQKRNLREEKKGQAEKQIKLRLTLHHIYKEEKIETTEKDVMERLEALVMQYPKAEQDKIRKNYAVGTQGYVQLKNNLLLEKFFEKFLS